MSSLFENDLFQALRAADADDPASQIDVFTLAPATAPGLNPWAVYAAVQAYEAKSWVANVVRPVMRDSITVTLTRVGRRVA